MNSLRARATAAALNRSNGDCKLRAIAENLAAEIYASGRRRFQSSVNHNALQAECSARIDPSQTSRCRKSPRSRRARASSSATIAHRTHCRQPSALRRSSYSAHPTSHNWRPVDRRRRGIVREEMACAPCPATPARSLSNPNAFAAIGRARLAAIERVLNESNQLSAVSYQSSA